MPRPVTLDAATGAHPTSGTALLRRAVWRSRRRLVLGYPLIMGWQLGEALVPVVIGAVVDHGIATGDGPAFLAWMLVLVAVFVMLSLCYRFGARQGVRSILEEEHRLRGEISAHVLHPLGARTSLLPGETLSLGTSDAALAPVVVRQLGYTVGSVTAVIVVAAYLLGVNVGLALLVLLGVPLVVVAAQLLSPLVARRSMQRQATIARASGIATDLVRGLRPLKGIGGEAAASARYRRASSAAMHTTIGMARSWGYLTGLTTTLSGLFLALVTFVAGSLAVDGGITLGELIAVVGLTQYLAEPITALGQLSAQAATSLASARRIAAFLATPRLLTDGCRTPDGPATLDVAGLTAGPLRGLSLEVRPGHVTAVVVDDPATSDALVAVLRGELLPDAGHVELAGVPLQQTAVVSRRRLLVVNPRHTEIGEGSVREVIDPDRRLGPAALDAVVEAAAVGELVDAHPRGLDRHVLTAGTTLSGGQRQRLTLARALATGAGVLVLQDPTSSVDAVTEQVIADRLRAVRGSGATLVLTDSPALLDVADVVLLVVDGRVTARGAHHELLARPDYRDLVLR